MSDDKRQNHQPGVHAPDRGPAQSNPPRGRAIDDEDPQRRPMDSPADPARHKHGNIETDTPGEQQSIDDINSAVTEIIEQSDKAGPSRGGKK